VTGRRGQSAAAYRCLPGAMWRPLQGFAGCTLRLGQRSCFCQDSRPKSLGPRHKTQEEALEGGRHLSQAQTGRHAQTRARRQRLSHTASHCLTLQCTGGAQQSRAERARQVAHNTQRDTLMPLLPSGWPAGAQLACKLHDRLLFSHSFAAHSLVGSDSLDLPARQAASEWPELSSGHSLVCVTVSSVWCRAES